MLLGLHPTSGPGSLLPGLFSSKISTFRSAANPASLGASRNEPRHHLQPRTLLSGAFSCVLFAQHPARN
jgi:hypothetical protein